MLEKGKRGEEEEEEGKNKMKTKGNKTIKSK